jgi:hypothetical protein
MDTLNLAALPTAGHVVTADLEQVTLDLGPAPLDEILDFRQQHGPQHRAYARDLRQFVRDAAALSQADQHQAFLDRREALADAADELRRLARTSWRRPLATFGLGIAGSAVALTYGNPIGAGLTAAGALLGLRRQADPASYLFPGPAAPVRPASALTDTASKCRQITATYRWRSQVAIEAADVNLVGLPDELAFTTAAALGCRYATAFRAVVHQGRVRAGEWVAVHGCGGVGLSAVQVAAAAGARVVAVDVTPGALDLAVRVGAAAVVDATLTDPALAVLELTGGGAALSLDALGSAATCVGSVACLRPRGRHVQVGLLPPALGRPEVPMDRVVALELELLGSHGMAAHDFPELLALVAAGRLRPQELVTRLLTLEEAPEALDAIGGTPGISVISTF